MRKLSIIIPIYNVETYLPACLDSVLAYPTEDCEILAVDDGSTDGSRALAEDYARRYPRRIRLIARENGGLGAARNTGIDAAEGEYLLFLDSDDTLAPGALKEMLETLDRDRDRDILFFDYVSVNIKGRVLSYQSGCDREGGFRLDDDSALLFAPPSACNKLWRRSLFTESGIRFPEGLWFEDLATCPRLYLRAGQMGAVHRPWLRYLQRPGSITRSRDPRRNREIIPAVNLVLEDFWAQGCLQTYGQELEMLSVQHQLLAATVRVNLARPGSPLQGELLRDLDAKFPHWRDNPYLSRLSARHRLLLRLMDRGQYRTLHALMLANALARRKPV